MEVQDALRYDEFSSAIYRFDQPGSCFGIEFRVAAFKNGWMQGMTGCCLHHVTSFINTITKLTSEIFRRLEIC